MPEASISKILIVGFWREIQSSKVWSQGRGLDPIYNLYNPDW